MDYTSPEKTLASVLSHAYGITIDPKNMNKSRCADVGYYLVTFKRAVRNDIPNYWQIFYRSEGEQPDEGNITYLVGSTDEPHCEVYYKVTHRTDRKERINRSAHADFLERKLKKMTGHRMFSDDDAKEVINKHASSTYNYPLFMTITVLCFIWSLVHLLFPTIYFDGLVMTVIICASWFIPNWVARKAIRDRLVRDAQRLGVSSNDVAECHFRFKTLLPESRSELYELLLKKRKQLMYGSI